MGDISSISGIVRILEPPKTFTNSMTQFKAQFPQIRSDFIVNLKCWGNLAHDVANYYDVNDYILIEGYFSSHVSNTVPTLKIFNIVVLKIYPFRLKSLN